MRTFRWLIASFLVALSAIGAAQPANDAAQEKRITLSFDDAPRHAAKTADEAYADPVACILPDAPVSQGTLVEMIAWDRGVPPPRWYERDDTAIAQAEFDRRVLGKGRTPP